MFIGIDDIRSVKETITDQIVELYKIIPEITDIPNTKEVLNKLIKVYHRIEMRSIDISRLAEQMQVALEEYAETNKLESLTVDIQEVKSPDCRQVMLDKSLSEEYIAIAEYEKRAIKCEEHDDTKLAELFKELARDEKVHVAQLQKAKELLGFNDKEIENEGSKEAEEILMNEAVEIPIKNTGILEVPNDEKVYDLPQSHFAKLIDKKGYQPIIRALTNLEVWNRATNPNLSTWASNMADKLKQQFRPDDENMKLEAKVQDILDKISEEL